MMLNIRLLKYKLRKRWWGENDDDMIQHLNLNLNQVAYAIENVSSKEFKWLTNIIISSFYSYYKRRSETQMAETYLGWYMPIKRQITKKLDNGTYVSYCEIGMNTIFCAFVTVLKQFQCIFQDF